MPSREDADSARTDEQPSDDQDDTQQHLTTHGGDDASDDEDDGEQPEHGDHETSRGRCIAMDGDLVDVTTSPGGCVHPNG